MSEYQYYEFRAVDRALTPTEQERLRQLSSRAEITRWSFSNDYSFGDFKGRPEDLMETMFDAHIYVANWGTRKFMLRLPTVTLSRSLAEVYLRHKDCDVWTESGSTILTFMSNEEDGRDETTRGNWMTTLLPLRADLMSGDRRCLYLTWLLAVQDGQFEDSELEPPVPPGLQHLTPSLSAFSEFLHIDPDLVEAAGTGDSAEGLEAQFPSWVRQLDVKEKDQVLVRLLQGERDTVVGELSNRFQHESDPATPVRRTVATLLSSADTVRAECQQSTAARRAVELAAAEKQAAAMKAAKLKALAREGERVWNRVDSMVQKQTASQYDTAVELLLDLRELAVHKGRTASFEHRLGELRQHHTGRGLLARLQKAGLA